MAMGKAQQMIKRAEQLEARAAKYGSRKKTALFVKFAAKFDGDEAKVGLTGMQVNLGLTAALLICVLLHAPGLLMLPLLLLAVAIMLLLVYPAEGAMCLKNAGKLRENAASL